MKRLSVLLMKPYLGLGYLASAIRKNHEVIILDGVREKLTLAGFAQLLEEKSFDVIGIQIFTFHLNILEKYLEIIKNKNPKIITIVGGPQPSCSPAETLGKFKNLDYAFRGEAEIGLSNLLDALAEDQLTEEKKITIPGLIWRQSSGTVIVNDQMFVKDLDSLGMPAWDLLNFDKYPTSAPHSAFYKNTPIAPMTTTRGCPFDCTFCAGRMISGRKVRARSVASIIKEIEYLHDQFGVKEISFEDDNFTFDRSRTMEFCRELIKKPWQISFAFVNGIRLDTLDKELLLSLKAAGLYEVMVGIESGSDRVLKIMHKSLTASIIRDRVKLIQDSGLEAMGSFIIGYPGETRKEILETFKFARDLGLKRANFAIFKPFPGTPITVKLMEEGQIDFTNQDWDNFFLAKAAYAAPGFTAQELKNLRRYGFLRFYLRPVIFYKLLRDIRSFSHFKFIAKRIFRWIFK